MLETTSVHENICTVGISRLCSVEVFVTQVGILRYQSFCFVKELELKAPRLVHDTSGYRGIPV